MIDESVTLTDTSRLDVDNRTSVTLDEDDPFVDAFDTEEFVVYEDAALARPIDQEYVIGGSRFTMRKDADELKKAQWQLDGHRVTLHHPSDDRVTDHNEIRGATRDPWYDEETDTQRADVFLPKNDPQAIEFADESGGISVAFSPGYDTDVEDVDAIQTDMVYDHVAITPNGRCSIEDGCGLFVTDSTGSTNAGPSPSLYKATCSEGPCTCGGHVDDDLCLVDSTESPDEDKGRFPIGSEADLHAAWEHLTDETLDGVDVDRETVEQRFADRADELGVESRPWSEEHFNSTMTDGDNFGIELEDLGTHTVVDRHDGVAEEIESLKEEKQSLADEKETLAEEKESLEDENEELRSFVSDSLEDQFEEKRDALTDAAEVFDEDDLDDQWDATDSIGEKRSFLDDMGDKLALVDAVVGDSEEEDTTEGLVSGSTVTDSRTKERDRAVDVEYDERGRVDLRSK